MAAAGTSSASVLHTGEGVTAEYDTSGYHNIEEPNFKLKNKLVERVGSNARAKRENTCESASKGLSKGISTMKIIQAQHLCSRACNLRPATASSHRLQSHPGLALEPHVSSTSSRQCLLRVSASSWDIPVPSSTSRLPSLRPRNAWLANRHQRHS